MKSLSARVVLWAGERTQLSPTTVESTWVMRGGTTVFLLLSRAYVLLIPRLEMRLEAEDFAGIFWIMSEGFSLIIAAS